MNPKPAADICPLCKGNRILLWFKDRKREYLHCPQCGLIFVPRQYHLSLEDEKAVYDLHENNPEDEGYKKFLSRLYRPLLDRLPPGQSGLDFGCGPGPVLSMLLEEGGHKLSLYDPFYFNTPSELDKHFDFITATEVLEHLVEPGREFEHLFAMLKTGGQLGMMTKMVIDKEAFSRWHYIQDPTHICFFSRKTFEYLAVVYNSNLEFIGNDVILMEKK